MKTLLDECNHICFSAAGRSEICEGRCLVSGCVCGFSPGLKRACPECSLSINLRHFRKSRHFLQTKCEGYFTPLVSWKYTWTGTEFQFRSQKARVLHGLNVVFQLTRMSFSGLWTRHSSSSFIPVWRTWLKQKSSSALHRLIRLITTSLQSGWTTYLR